MVLYLYLWLADRVYKLTLYCLIGSSEKSSTMCKQCMIFVTAQLCQGFSPLLVWMKGKCMHESNTTICMGAPTMLFFTYQFKEQWKAISSWEQHWSSYMLWESFIQGVGIFDCSQLLKIELNGSLPMNDTTKTHGIYECYHIRDLFITTISHLDHHGC